MSIRKAELINLEIIKDITVSTIQAIYPHYYAQGAVDFFLAHHKETSIRSDIQDNMVMLCYDESDHAVGTVTIKNNEVCRLFVLPQHQGCGFGREMLNYAEKRILETYDTIVLDASLPAKRIYLKRGYSVMDFHVIETANGDFLCYDVMMKKRGST